MRHAIRPPAGDCSTVSKKTGLLRNNGCVDMSAAEPCGSLVRAAMVPERDAPANVEPPPHRRGRKEKVLAGPSHPAVNPSDDSVVESMSKDYKSLVCT
jgi:hypothetical protein